MKLIPKVDENGNVVMSEDKTKVIYLDEDDNNKEYPLDPAAMYVKILNLGTENKTHREKAKELETKLKPFESIDGIDLENSDEWITNATTAITTVKNFDDKQLVDAGKVEEVKKEMREAYESQLSAKDEAIESLKVQHTNDVTKKDDQIRTLMVTNQFNTSKYFTGENPITTLPPDAGEALFGRHFKVEDQDGKPVLKAYADDGKTELLSKLNPGEPALFEEALGLIIDKYPNKDAIIKAAPGGSGGGGGGGGGTPIDEISKLEAEIQQAQKDGDAGRMVTAKNALFALKKKQK